MMLPWLLTAMRCTKGQQCLSVTGCGKKSLREPIKRKIIKEYKRYVKRWIEEAGD